MSQKLILTNMPAGKDQVLAGVLKNASGRIEAFFLYPASGDELRPGEIYLAAVDRIHRQTDGAFLRIRDKQIVYMPFHGFYSAADYCMKCKADRPLRAGDELLIQIDAAAQKTKRPRAYGELNLSGRYVAAATRDPGLHFSRKLPAADQKRIRALLGKCIPEGEQPRYGYIIRTNAASAPEDSILREISDLTERLDKILQEGCTRPAGTCLYRPDAPWKHLLDHIDFEGGSERGEDSTETLQDRPEIITDRPEIITDRPEIFRFLEQYLSAFANKPGLRLYDDPLLPLFKLHNLPRELERLTEKRVWLKSGAMIIIEQTEAFVAVDVNTGKYAGNSGKEETALRINLEAAEEILRQLRLRQLSGTVLIDFINMKDAAGNQQLMTFLRQKAADDAVRTSVVDMTALGIVEMTREKRYRPLAEELRRLQ